MMGVSLSAYEWKGRKRQESTGNTWIYFQKRTGTDPNWLIIGLFNYELQA